MKQIESDKLKLILALKEIPIVLVACKKVGLDKSTFYRWKHDDPRFAREVNRAVSRGRDHISDIAEAHVVQGVKKGDKNYVMGWLKAHRHPYKRAEKTVVDVNHKIQTTKQTEKRGRRDVLMPSISTELPTNISPKTQKMLEAAVDKIFNDSLKEEVLIKELAKKGMSGEEIEKLLKKMRGSNLKDLRNRDTDRSGMETD